MRDGLVFEQGGVNFSHVEAILEGLAVRLSGDKAEIESFATQGLYHTAVTWEIFRYW